MRRQLRARGGITNARQGYGIGSWVKERIRKIIPNELASVASKAAPFVAMLPGYGPLAAGIMRGVGRFDKRGSISDALKQGVGTYAGGKLFDKGMQGLDLRGTDGSAFKSLKELPSKIMEKGGDFISKGIDTVGKSGTASEILKGQLLVGGGTAIASFIASQFAEDPQQSGESFSEYMARRRPVVEKNLKMYLGQSNPGMSQEDLDRLVQQNLAEYTASATEGAGGYNKGGRVGLANGSGGISMTNTLAQNRAINNARRMANQGVLQAARNRMITPSRITPSQITPSQITPSRITPSQITPSRITPSQITPSQITPSRITPSQITPSQMVNSQMTNTPVGTATPSGVISVMPQLSNNNSPTNNFYTPPGTNPYGMVANTGIPRGPNGGYIIDGVEYMSEQEAIDAMGLERYNQLMSKGGRVGLAEGSNDMILPMKKPEVERMLTYEEAKALDPQMFVDTTTSNPIPDNAAELAIDELARVILGTRGSDKNFMKNEYIIPTVKKISENYGYSEAEIVKMLKDQMMTYSKPKKEKMNKGGLMGLNRTGFDKGSNPVLSLIEKISPLFVDEDGDYRSGLQKARLALAKLVTKKGYDLGIGAEWYNKLDEDTQKEILLEKIKYREMNPDNDEERREFTMSDGTIKKGAPMYPKRITEMPVYDEADAGRFRYGAAMNKGGLMRLNYMIGGEAKQMEAGAPPIIYEGNMDPNAQAGLPSTPGPIQMAEDGPEFDMRENGGFQPLGRQEGKDDVPAMLAKNEFVMTADAVRAAGGGSIQKGAQKMYDTMKKLESRVS